MQLGDGYTPTSAALKLSPVDTWMRSRLAAAVTAVNAGFKDYDFVAATSAIYNLWLYDFCDYYLEATKVRGGCESLCRVPISDSLPSSLRL